MTNKNQIPEGILIGIKDRNKHKVFCKRGHLLPRERISGHRICKHCVAIRNYNNIDKRSESQRNDRMKRDRIKESKFPMVERLKVRGILN